MFGVHRVAFAATVALGLLACTAAPAKAQFAPLGGGGGDMMTQMAPMLEMMKAKMGKRRFAMLMQTMGPMMAKMMDGGGSFGGMPGIGGFGDGASFIPGGIGAGIDGGDVMGMLGGNGGEMMSMIPQLMQLAGAGSGYGHRRYRRHW
jgi:hypothetical protein